MLNWLSRYAAVRPLLLDADGNATGSILDVGSGPHGLACAAPGVPFVGADLEFPGPVAPEMAALRVAPGPLPLADASLDWVVSLDALEHVPPGDRRAFVAELARVAARGVLLACPSDEGAAIDALVGRALAGAGHPLPGWLLEHEEHGLPTAEEIEACCTVEGFTTEPLAVPNGLLSTLVVLGDVLPDLAGAAAAEHRAHREEWLRLLETARFGRCYRKGFVLRRETARVATVSAADPHGTLPAALRCPACTGALATEGDDALRCTGCAARVVRHPSGAWDLRAVARPPAGRAPAAPGGGLDTRAPLKLWLRPDWRDPRTWLPALSVHVREAPADGTACLCLDASAPEVPLALVVELLGAACAHLADGPEFAEVLVVDEPVDLAQEDVVPVTSAADARAALGLPPAAPPADDAELVAHARAAKRLVDELTALADRRLAEAAPDPFAEREPLVSVRIPTWHGHRLLVERAIPSALAQSYGNVEVVVCSDGPDPEARRAVEGFRDPRVRYLELPERPAYPTHFHSLWETGGIHAVNAALDACRGTWIAPLDHDDAFTRDHVAGLLAHARRERADLTYGRALCEDRRGTWFPVGEAPLRHGGICHGSALVGPRFAHARLDADCWLREEPGDWNLWRRLVEAGARPAFLPEVVLLHFREKTAVEADPAAAGVRLDAPPPPREIADVARDVRGTAAAVLLEVALPPALVRA